MFAQGERVVDVWGPVVSNIGSVIAAIALAGVVILVIAVRLLRRRRILAGIFGSASALALFLAATAMMLLATSLLTYQRLTYEQPAAELHLSRTAAQQFDAVLTYPGGVSEHYALRGDEWQIDARMLKWRAFVNLIGFDSAYRLERIGGRYTTIESERSAPRTVYALNPPSQIDIWELARRYKDWMPWVDARYGSATYLPMADGALYEIKVAQSGLTARPLNEAARKAVGSWQ